MKLLLETADARELDVEVAGAPHGPLVLVQQGTPEGHGLPASYVRAAERLGLRLASWARPGYARSTRRPGRTVADAVTDALAVADLLGAPRFAAVGASGGGPHVLALGALAPERCLAIATLAGVGPFGEPDLDPLAGMGEGNLVEFAAAQQGEQPLRALLEQWRPDIVGGGVQSMIDGMVSVLSPPDVAVLDHEFGAEVLAGMRTALDGGVDGWLDDDLAFVAPWGFAVSDVAVPVQVWQGAQDLMVPVAHAQWLAGRLPSGRLELLADDGHLTLQAGRLEEVLTPLAQALA